jgi:hypothetical protein
MVGHTDLSGTLSVIGATVISQAAIGLITREKTMILGRSRYLLGIILHSILRLTLDHEIEA